MVRISGDNDILNFNDYRKDDRAYTSKVEELNKSVNGRRGL
jgi:hypothetical protein|tara:strand:+ start:729 stop:851 length:123 start_codon:yes stop_codon:yes gene_type:complete